MRRWLLITALLLTVSAASQAWAGDVEDCARFPWPGVKSRVLAACRHLADQGDAIAEYRLGVLYDKGQGVPQDHVEAARWYRKAADHGYADGQSILGTLYLAGLGVPQDYVQAYMWLTLAAVQGDIDAADIRDAEAAAWMTPAQIEQAKALAAGWKPTNGQ